MDYKQALEEALAAVNAQAAQQQAAANIEAGNAAYGKLAEEADTRRSIERQRLAKRMAEMGIAGPQSLTIQNNSMMAGYSDIGDISRQNQRYTGMQNAMKEQADANAAAQAAEITADMNAAEDASDLEDTNNRYDRYYRMYMAKKMTRSQFKKKTGMDVRGWAARRANKTPTTFEKNKAIIKAAKSTGMFDNWAGTNIEKLTPQQAQQMADYINKTYADIQKKYENYSHIGAPYPGAPVTDRFVKPSNNLTSRGYEDSRTSGGQIAPSKPVNADTKDGAISVYNVPEGYTGRVIGPVKSKRSPLEWTGLGIRLNPTANYERSKTIIKNAQYFGIADQNLDVDSLTPKDAAREAQGILNSVNKAAEAYENYRKVGAPYPGAPSLGRFAIPYEQMNVADLDALLPAEQAKLDDLKVQYDNATREWNDYYKIWEYIGNDPKKNGKALEIKKELDAQAGTVQAIKAGRPFAAQAEEKNKIEKKIMNMPDFQQVVRNPLKKYMWNISESYTGQAMERKRSVIDLGFYYTGEEKQVLTYLKEKGDEETYNQYKKSLGHIVDKRRATSDYAYVQNAMKGNDGWEKARLIFGSFVEAPNAIAALAENGYNWITGQQTDPYSDAQQMAARPAYIREISLVDASPFMKFLGGVGYSIGDVITTLPFGGTASLAILSSEAGGQTSNDIIRRGGTPGQAFWGGMLAAGTEAITEKLPIDNIFKMAKSGTKLFSKQGLLNILKQSGIEGTEEWISDIVNTLSDYAIMGDKSNIGLRVKELRDSGLSESEAQKKAFDEFFVQKPMESALGGFVSGGIFGTGTDIVSDIRGGISTNIDSKERNGDNILEQIDIKKANEAWKLIDRFRTDTNGFEPLGDIIPEKGDNRGTVALIKVNGKKICGVNSALLGYEEKNLGRKYFTEMQGAGYFQRVQRYGQGSAQVFTHAEGHALLKAYEMLGSKLGENVTIYTDRATCEICKKYLPILKEYLRIKHLIIVNKNGNIFRY